MPRSKKYRNRKRRITIPGRVSAAASQPRSEKATEAASESHPARPLLRTARPLFCSWAFSLLSTIFRASTKACSQSEERRRCCQPEPVFIVDRHNEAGLAREIETAEMVSLGLEDHSLGSHAASNRRSAPLAPPS